MPVETTQIKSLGYAGMLSEDHNGVFLVAGGANLHNGLPCEGGKKFGGSTFIIFENSQLDLS